MEHENKKPIEIKSMERALHNVLWIGNRSPLLRQAKSDWVKGILSPNRIEALLIQAGWQKVESSKWKKVAESAPPPNYNKSKNYPKTKR